MPHIHPFRPYGRYASFYPYYLPSYYSNYFPRSYNRYYQPVQSSIVALKKGPKHRGVQQSSIGPKAYQAKHKLIVLMVVLLFIYGLTVALK